MTYNQVVSNTKKGMKFRLMSAVDVLFCGNSCKYGRLSADEVTVSWSNQKSNNKDDFYAPTKSILDVRVTYRVIS